jgi:hypothetical protein
MKFGETQEKQEVVKPVKTKKYNTTDLDPETTFERHVFHRDQFAHYLRWTHILKVAKIGEKIVDFGCGKGNLLEVLYRNRFKSGKELTGIIEDSFIYKRTMQEYLTVNCEGKKYSVNPKNIINETN